MVLLFYNFMAWLFFHFAISFGLLLLPDSFFSANHWSNGLFKERGFEEKGKFWKKYTRVNRWKDRLPDGASLFNVGYKKKTLPSKRLDSVRLFIMETKRAELTHWLLMVPAPFFFLWNPPWAGWLMIGYALIVNLPFILIQRYNRSRLIAIEKRMKR